MLDFPKKVFVEQLIKGRYPLATKPLTWDDRVGGIDVVVDKEGQQYKLDSAGDQSCPVHGWQILLTSPGSEPDTYKWTLYGIS